MTPPARPPYEELRHDLVRRVEEEVRATAAELGKPELDPRVVAALRAVPRHEFVRPEDALRAYANVPLSIGFGQTISQPYIVAIMTDLLATRPQDRILEVGTGSGYQAAVLAELVDRIYSIEIVALLAERAAATLSRLGYHNVEVRAGDGRRGWPEAAPFDGIVVTAAGSEVPGALFDQLRDGGRLVAPVECGTYEQMLRVYEKIGNEIRGRDVLPVVFVPLTRDEAR